MTFEEVVTRLEAALQQPLPGTAAQALLAPQPRRQWPSGFNPARVRDAAGLLLAFPLEERPHIVLTVRADTLGRHSGQVSLPGGVVEPGETFAQAALREAHEEIALPLDNVRVLGGLTSLDIPVSGFRLYPVVAAVPSRPALRPSDGEVARVLVIALDELSDPAHFTVSTAERDGHFLTIPAFRVHDVDIWGATAMVLAEFLTLLGWPGPLAR